MTSSAERFWKTVAAWERDHVRLLVEFVRLDAAPYEVWTVEGCISEVQDELVSFRADGSGETRSLNFARADVRDLPFEPLEGVRAFAAMWPDGAQVRVTEVRVFGRPT
jgi:hypothetical protein